MLRLLTFFCFSYMLCVTVYTVDITTRSGTVYKDSSVVGTMPDGILVNYTSDNGFDTVKLINFKDLPASEQKKYGYNSKNAETYEKDHQEWLNRQMEAEQKKLTKSSEKNQKEVADDSVQTQKEKLAVLEKSLDKMSSGNPQSAGSDGLSITGLVHDAVSATENQSKEMDDLEK